METAPHFICKDCLQTSYDALKSPCLKGVCGGGELITDRVRIDLLK